MQTSVDVPVAAEARSKRGDHTMIAEWLCRIRAEYLEVPGLNLTRQQAKRLWGLDDVMCDGLLKALVDARFLRLTATGTYIRAD